MTPSPRIPGPLLLPALSSLTLSSLRRRAGHQAARDPVGVNCKAAPPYQMPCEDAEPTAV